MKLYSTVCITEVPLAAVFNAPYWPDWKHLRAPCSSVWFSASWSNYLMQSDLVSPGLIELALCWSYSFVITPAALYSPGHYSLVWLIFSQSNWTLIWFPPSTTVNVSVKGLCLQSYHTISTVIFCHHRHSTWGVESTLRGCSTAFKQSDAPFYGSFIQPLPI